MDGVRSIELVLTAACNLACVYCYQRAHPARSMDWETLAAAIDLLSRSAAPEVTLGFYGGEPLLERGLLVRAVEYAERSRAGASGRRLRLRLITNGTLLDWALAAFLDEHQVDLRLSFDGVPPAQDARRGSSFGQLHSLLCVLRSERPRYVANHVSACVTLTAANLHSLADSVACLLECGVAAILIAPTLTPDPAWSAELEPELDRQLERVAEASVRHWRWTGRLPVGLFRRPAHCPPDAAQPRPCGAGRADSLVVDVDGRVTTCVMLVASYEALPATPLGERLGSLVLGRITDPDLGDRLATYRAAAAASGLFDPACARSGVCSSCPDNRDCVPCAAAVAALPANADPHAVPPLPCAFHRLVARHRAAFPVQPSLADLARHGFRVLAEGVATAGH